MKITVIIALLLAVQQILSAQDSFVLKGRIFDDSTNVPVPYATVYVDGTTNGTISDSTGQFVLSDVRNSSVIVVSHVSYEPKTITIQKDTSSVITIWLREKDIEISAVNIADNNLRDENLKIFKNTFIGRDSWGESTQLLNDSVLLFNCHYDYQKVMLNDAIRKNIDAGYVTNIEEWDEDSTYVILKVLTDFDVIARAPLNIDMPLLGYNLRVDLFNFNISAEQEHAKVKFLGYYYFQPYETKSKTKINRMERNRRMVYYNSSKHFFTSLYENNLARNGYKVTEMLYDSVTNKNEEVNVNFENYVNYIDNNQLQIIGLKDREFSITYYGNSKYEPFDFYITSKDALEDAYHIEKSKLYFLKDTCIVNSDGTIPNTDIMFGGSISRKRVGSYLPANYEVKD